MTNSLVDMVEKGLTFLLPTLLSCIADDPLLTEKDALRCMESSFACG